MSVRQGPWTVADVPGQSGRVAVVTGANSGIGFEAATVLARRGAHTVLACRNAGRAEDGLTRLSAAAPEATVSVVRLDLASLESIRAAADQILATHDRLDLLINNAGLMWPPYGRTADGLELQFGTNHLGHFAFTGLVIEAMLPVPGSRGGHREQHRPPGGPDQLRRPAVRAALRPDDRLRAVQAGEPDVHLWAESERLTGVTYPV